MIKKKCTLIDYTLADGNLNSNNMDLIKNGKNPCNYDVTLCEYTPPSLILKNKLVDLNPA